MLSVKDVKAAFPEYKINITSHAYTHPGVHTLPKVDKLTYLKVVPLMLGRVVNMNQNSCWNM